MPSQMRALLLFFRMLNIPGLNNYFMEFLDSYQFVFLFPRRWFAASLGFQQLFWKRAHCRIFGHFGDCQCPLKQLIEDDGRVKLEQFQHCFFNDEECDQFVRREWDHVKWTQSPPWGPDHLPIGILPPNPLRSKIKCKHIYRVFTLHRILYREQHLCACRPRGAPILFQTKTFRYQIHQINSMDETNVNIKFYYRKKLIDVNLTKVEFLNIIYECILHGSISTIVRHCHWMNSCSWSFMKI